MMGNDAIDFFLDSFKRQAWLEDSLKPWVKRQNNKGSRNGRAVLVDSGRLGRSIRITGKMKDKSRSAQTYPKLRPAVKVLKARLKLRLTSEITLKRRRLEAGNLLKPVKNE